MDQLSELELSVNRTINNMSWCDCDVIPSPFGSFAIACSEDLTYYHTIELVFTDVLFTHCRYDFHVDKDKGFFVITDSTTLPISLNEDVKAAGYKLYIIAEEDGALYCIASKGLSVNLGSALRYYTTDLKDGQRLASWIVPAV